MARILENDSSRRIIQLSTSDILAIVREYQQIVGANRNIEDVTSLLEDKAIFIPES